MPECQCGCKQETKTPSAKYVKGHWSKSAEARSAQSSRINQPHIKAHLLTRLREDNPTRKPENAKKASERIKGDRNPLRRMPERNPMKVAATAAKQGRTVSGDNNPSARRWGIDPDREKKKASAYRGPPKEWQAARVQALIIAGAACARCQATSGLSVHHIASPDDGVSWNNRQENLEVLCRSCHGKLHHPKQK